MNFYKYHGLGNSYLVVEADGALSAENIKTICNPNFGIGSDGVLVAVRSDCADFGVQIFNPDGSEAEKSGNGLRIFAAYLHEKRLVGGASFTIETAGGVVEATVLHTDGVESDVRVEMGAVAIEAVGERLAVGAERLTVAVVSVGNPHCVVVDGAAAVSAEIAQLIGPQIETHPRFPAKTNVQFLRPIDDHTIFIEIWERGAGYTLASGSSSCAAAAVAVQAGLAQSPVTVQMPGGELLVEISAEFDAILTGPVSKIADGDMMSDENRQ